MIFPQYGYKEFNTTNKKDWAIQPPTIESWCKMLNDAHTYCNDLNDIFEFEMIYNIKACDLPSIHPYWKLQTFKGTLDFIDGQRNQIEQINKTIKFSHNHKYIGNMRTSIVNLQRSIIHATSVLKYG